MSYGIEAVREFLNSHGIEAEISTFDESTRTSELAAAAIGCEVGQIAKSLIVLADNRQLVLLIASGTSRVEMKKLASTLGEQRVAMTDAETVKRITGFPIRGVPPVAHTTRLRTIFDPALMRWEVVYASAGTPNAVFRIKPAELLKVTNAEVVQEVFRNSA